MTVALGAVASTPKDVVIATTGASAALGGLILVFLGLLVAAYQSFPADTPASVKARARNAAWPIVGVFVLCIASVAIGFLWLEEGGDNTLYTASNVIFAAELVAILVAAVCTARGMLR